MEIGRGQETDRGGLREKKAGKRKTGRGQKGYMDMGRDRRGAARGRVQEEDSREAGGRRGAQTKRPETIRP